MTHEDALRVIALLERSDAGQNVIIFILGGILSLVILLKVGQK